MFTPNPAKAQEPVFLTPDNIFTLHLKANSEIKDPNANPNRIDLNKNRTVLLAKSVRWRATDDVKVEFNRDMTKPDLPTKYFADNRGEFAVSTEINRVSFCSSQGQGVVKLYIEIA